MNNETLRIVLIHRRSFQERPPVISVYSHLVSLGFNPILITAGINRYYEDVLQNNKTPYYVIPFKINKNNQLRNIINGFIWGYKVRRLINRISKNGNLLLWIEGNYTFDSLSAAFVNKYPHILQNQELFNSPMTYKGRYTMRTLKHIMPTSIVNIAPEYNRACIYKSLFQLKEKPVILPNKPTFILSNDEIQMLADKYEAYREIIGSRKVILYQGILSKERNLENFVRAASELNKNEYVTVLLGRVTPLVRKYKSIDPDLLHIDFIPAPDYLYFTQLAYIGIVTYTPDSLNTTYCAPNKLFEYGAYGIPMIGNDIAGLKYTIGYYGCGEVCDENSVSNIKDTINKIINNYSEYSKRSYNYYNSTNNKDVVNKIVNIAMKKTGCKLQ